MPLVAWSPLTQASRVASSGVQVKVKVQALHRLKPQQLTSLAMHFYPSYLVVKVQIASEPEVPNRKQVELIGVEPTTSSLQSWRSTN